MKIRLLLLALLALPLAALRTYDIHYHIDWVTGFLDVDVPEAVLLVLLFVSVLLMIPYVRHLCKKRGLAAFPPKKSFLSGLLSVLTGLGLIACRVFRTSLPAPASQDLPAYRVLTVLATVLQAAAALALILGGLLRAPASPLATAIRTSLYPLALSTEMMLRYFSGIGNPYDTTKDISFVTLAVLIMAMLRWNQYSTVLSERRQRSFLSWALIAFLVGAGWRLPTLSMYLSPLNRELLIPVVADFLGCFLALSLGFDAIGQEF